LGDGNSDGESAATGVSGRDRNATPTGGAGADEDRGDVPTCRPRSLESAFSRREQEEPEEERERARSPEDERERARSSVATALQRRARQRAAVAEVDARREQCRVPDRREHAAKAIQCSQRRRVSVAEPNVLRAKAEREREMEHEHKRETEREMEHEREVEHEREIKERERDIKEREREIMECQRETLEREREMEREREAAAIKLQCFRRRRSSTNRVERLRAERKEPGRPARPRHRGHHHHRHLTNAARDSDVDGDAKVDREEIIHSFLRLRWIATPRETLRALLARGDVFELFSRFCSKMDADGITSAGGSQEMGTMSNGLALGADAASVESGLSARAPSVEGDGDDRAGEAGLLTGGGWVQALLDRWSCSRAETSDISEQQMGARGFELLALAYLPKFLADRSAYAELRRLIDANDTLLETLPPSTNLAEVWLGAFANVIERLPQGVVVVDVTSPTLVVVLANSLCCRSCFGGVKAHPRAAMGMPLFSLYPHHAKPSPKAMQVALESLARGQSCDVQISANQMLSLRPVTDRSSRTRLCVGMHLDLRTNNTDSLLSRLLHQGAMLSALPCSF
jgi:hypothetical protein